MTAVVETTTDEPTDEGRSLRLPPPVWPFLAALVIWLIIRMVAGQGFTGILSAAVESSSILVIVGLGQLVVISTGNANIDLSIPNTMALSAYASTIVLDGDASRLWLGIAMAIACGLGVGIVNISIIRLFDLPAIVATMAVGFIIDSVTLHYSDRMTVGVPRSIPDALSSSTLGLLNLAWIAIAITLVGGFVVARTVWGRMLFGVGQSRRVAHFSGYSWRTGETVAFLISGVLAAVGGMLLGWDIGPEIGFGSRYLLASVAVVVLGGTLITGGRSYVSGLWGGALLLSLILTLVISVGLNPAYQSIVQGALILGILSFAARVNRT